MIYVLMFKIIKTKNGKMSAVHIIQYHRYIPLMLLLYSIADKNTNQILTRNQYIYVYH